MATNCHLIPTPHYLLFWWLEYFPHIATVSVWFVFKSLTSVNIGKNLKNNSTEPKIDLSRTQTNISSICYCKDIFMQILQIFAPVSKRENTPKEILYSWAVFLSVGFSCFPILKPCQRSPVHPRTAWDRTTLRDISKV